MLKSLQSEVKKSFPNYSDSCIGNVLILMLSMLKGSTVNLYQIRSQVAVITGKSTSAASGYKRLIRIFDRYSFSRLWLDLLIYVFQLLRLKSDCVVIDGTSWKRNGVKRHYLTLSIEYRSVAIPIYWVDLGKLGISSVKERKRMFRRVFKFFNLKGKVLLADREYIGKDWYSYLINNGLNFVIRLRYKNYKKLVDSAKGRNYQQMIDKVLRSKLPNKALSKQIIIDGQVYTFVVIKNSNPNPKDKDKIVFLLSSLDKSATYIAAYYRRRWGIECCFKHLKTNGFNLEQINLKGRARSKLLMAVMVFAYVLSIHHSLKTYDKVRTIVRKDGRTHKEVSVFRHGYDNLLAKIPSISDLCEYILTEIRLAQKAYRSAKWLIV